jgi:hypothetical protein
VNLVEPISVILRNFLYVFTTSQSGAFLCQLGHVLFSCETNAVFDFRTVQLAILQNSLSSVPRALTILIT